MNSTEKFRLLNILDKNEISERDISFLWIYIANHKNSKYKINQNNKINNNLIAKYKAETISEKFIADELLSDIELGSQARFDLKFHTIPDRYFDWLEDSIYQAYWIGEQIANRGAYKPGSQIQEPTPEEIQSRSNNMKLLSFTVPDDLMGRNRSIAMFDYWAKNRYPNNQERVSCINDLKRDWAIQAQMDSIFSWLKEGDAKTKRHLLWASLCSNGVKGTFGGIEPYSHDELMIFIHSNKLELHEKKFFNLSARKLWNQQQRRENNKDKKQCNFILSKETDAKLKKLADEYNLTRTEIIELLIDSEAKHRKYIDQRLHRKQRLTEQLQQ